MNLSNKAKKELKDIFSEDYGVTLSDDDLSKIGVSLLRMTKIGSIALARVDEHGSSTEPREINFLESDERN